MSKIFIQYQCTIVFELVSIDHVTQYEFKFKIQIMHMYHIPIIINIKNNRYTVNT